MSWSVPVPSLKEKENVPSWCSSVQFCQSSASNLFSGPQMTVPSGTNGYWQQSPGFCPNFWSDARRSFCQTPENQLG